MHRMEKFTNGAAVGAGTTTTLFGALSLNDWALVIGIACTIGTFIINWYYRDREFRRKSGGSDVTGTEK